MLVQVHSLSSYGTNVGKEDASSGWNTKKDIPESSNSDSWGFWGLKTKDDDANATPNWETRPGQMDSVVIENKEPYSVAWSSWGKPNPTAPDKDTKVLEISSVIDWDKGKAVAFLIESLDVFIE